MSNPYAPPGDQPQAPPPVPPDVGASAGGAGRHDEGAEGPPAPGRGDAASAGRSPEGVPYERRPAQRGLAPHPTDVRRVALLTRTTALLVLVSVLAGLLAFPWYLAAVPLALAAIVVGARTMTVATRGRVRGTPIGVVGLLMVVSLLSLARPAQTALMWDVERQFAQCRDGALTVQAQNACLSQYEQAVAARVQQLSGRS